MQTPHIFPVRQDSYNNLLARGQMNNEKIKIPDNIANRGIKEDTNIFFEEENALPRVFEIVNEILGPYGYESVSLGQFRRVAGGSANSSNKIENLAQGNGSIKNGFTSFKKISEYCQSVLDNSILIPLEAL